MHFGLSGKLRYYMNGNRENMVDDADVMAKRGRRKDAKTRESFDCLAGIHAYCIQIYLSTNGENIT